MASDTKTIDGLNPHFSSVDEYHEAKDNRLLRNLESGTVSRRQPHLLVITTAGFNKYGACYQLRKVAADVVKGNKVDDRDFFQSSSHLMMMTGTINQSGLKRIRQSVALRH